MARQLGLGTKIVYGSGDWSMSSFNTLRQIFYVAFLTDVVGLDPLLASFAMLLGVAWDAINDPFVGALSDRVRTSWGRRRPFLMLFALPFGLAYVGLWWAPPWEAQWALALHVALAYMVSDTLQSLITVPFFALTPELTSDYDERTTLVAWRMFFNLSAALAVAVASPSIVDTLMAQGSTAQQAHLVVGAIFGALGVVPPLLIAATVREKLDAVPETEPPIFQSLQNAWRNRTFRSVTLIYLLNWITFDLLGLMIPFYVRWYLAGGDTAASYTALGLTLPVESWMLGALLVVSLPMLPLWSYTSERLEKRSAYILAMSLWAVVQLLVFLVPPGAFGLAVLVAVAAAAGVAAAHVIPDAMLPDVIDLDELETGHRNEGVYYGARNFFRKAAGAMASFLALQTLGWAGYASQATSQSEGALFAIRLLTGPMGAVLLLGAMASAWFYPMTRARHARILADLAARADLRARS